MVEIGKYNTLKIVKDLDFGVYLDGRSFWDVFLFFPNEISKKMPKGGYVEYFVYSISIVAGGFPVQS